MFPAKTNSTSKKVEENVSQPLSQIFPHLIFFRTFPPFFKFHPPPPSPHSPLHTHTCVHALVHPIHNTNAMEVTIYRLVLTIGFCPENSQNIEMILVLLFVCKLK